MNNVTQLRRGVHLSLSALAGELGVARETVRRRLAEAGIQPSGERNGYPVYRLRDTLSAWAGTPESRFDPDALPPFQRKAFYESELRKLNLQVERGELLSTMEVERTMALIMMKCRQAFEIAPDILERDVGANPRQLARLEKHFDEIREQLYRDICEMDFANASPPSSRKG